ncbi:MAG: DUF6427 family protein [Bacteroidota bacterium]|nr:DUF6427 family protein [Bacteroidota bacterium]
MILNLFKNTQPFALILVPVFLAISWVSASYGESTFLVANPMPLYNVVFGFFSAWPSWAGGLFGFLLTTSQVFHLNYMVQKHEVLYKNSYLPALFNMLFISLIPQFLTFHPVLIANSILLFVLDKLFRIYKNPAAMSLAFDCCFLIGLATLFYLPAISFFLLFALSILILKTFSWRDWIVGLIGLALPFLFTFIYYFWIDDLDEFSNKFFLKNIRQLWDTGGLILQGYRITLGVVSFIFILTFIRIRQNFYKNVTRIRNFQQVIFLFLAVALLSLIFTSGSAAVYRFSILVIPLAVMISYYFLAAKKKWWTELLFWVLFGLVIFNHVNAIG